MAISGHFLYSVWPFTFSIVWQPWLLLSCRVTRRAFLRPKTTFWAELKSAWPKKKNPYGQALFWPNRAEFENWRLWKLKTLRPGLFLAELGRIWILQLMKLKNWSFFCAGWLVTLKKIAPAHLVFYSLFLKSCRIFFFQTKKYFLADF